MNTTGFQQVKIDGGGTYGAFNPTTSQAIAFPDQSTFSQYFSGTPDQSAPMAAFDTSGLLGANAGKLQAVTMNSLTPATPLAIPKAQPAASPLAGATAGATETAKSLQDYIKEMTPEESETSKKVDSITSSLETLLPGLTGRGAEQVKAEQDAGLPELKKKLSDLSSQILMKVAEVTKSDASYEQMIQQIENQQGVSMRAIIGQQAQARKMQLAEHNSKAADLGLLQAVASGMQGNLTAMQEQIDRAIDLKYSDKEAEVKLKLDQLKLLEGKLSKEEQITAKALERKYNAEQDAITEEKTKRKTNLLFANEAKITTPLMNKNGEWVRTTDGKGYATPEDLFKDFPQLEGSFANAYTKGLVTDYKAPSAILSVAEANALNVPYGTTEEQAMKMGITPKTASETKGPPGPPKPKVYPMTNTGVRNLLYDNKRANPDMNWFDLWGEIADEIVANGGNPKNFDAIFWEVLHPEGSAGFKKYNSTTNTSTGRTY